MPASSFRSGTIADVILSPLAKHADPRGSLTELFRLDELPDNLHPAMGYLSWTKPGIQRGPHEHRRQTDRFCFLGPGNFQFFLWDNRPASPTYGIFQEETLGQRRPASLIVPPGVVHAYRNISTRPGLVLNFPDHLYRGPGKQDEVDEIRHEDDPFSPFKVAPASRLRRRRVLKK